MVCICSNFSPYPADMLCHNAAVPLAVIAPNTLINPFFIKDLSWILRKQFHNIKFPFCKTDTLIAKEQATF